MPAGMIRKARDSEGEKYLEKAIRLDKYLADMGKGTRTELKEMIRRGRIKVNGMIVKKPEMKIKKGEDTICLDNAPVEYVELEYYLLNKPQGVISATEDRREKTCSRWAVLISIQKVCCSSQTMGRWPTVFSHRDITWTRCMRRDARALSQMRR